MALPDKYEGLLANNEKTLLEIAYTISSTNPGDNSTSTGRSESKRSKSTKVDMNKLYQMVEYVYNCNLSIRGTDISPYCERHDDGSYLSEQEESHLISTILYNLQQMKDSEMRFKTYRYYQILLSFMDATSSLIDEFNFSKLDKKAFYQHLQNRDNIDALEEMILQQEEQRVNANEGNEQGNEQDNEQ